MEYVNIKGYLEFPPGILQEVRKLYNLDNIDRMNEAIDLLADWIRKQNHFKVKEYPRDYLERCIIYSKGSVEKAKFRMERCCTMKTLLPSFFEITNPLAQIPEGYLNIGRIVVCPKMTKNYCSVLLCQCFEMAPDYPGFKKLYQFIMLCCEYARAHDYSAGYIIVLDFSECSLLDYIQKLNITELKQALTLYMEAYGMSPKQIHFVTNSKVVETVIEIVGQVLKEKILKRIIVHNSIDKLREHIPVEVLPKDYGGELKSAKELHDEGMKELNREENVEYFKKMKEAATEETLRLRKNVNEEFFNLTGTFRTLAVD